MRWLWSGNMMESWRSGKPESGDSGVVGEEEIVAWCQERLGQEESL